MSLFALGRGLTAVAAAHEFSTSLATGLAEYVDDVFVGRKREQGAAELAQNVVNDLALREGAVFLHSPPEVKGTVLDNILYDWWVTPDIWSSNDIKIRAVSEILASFQSWRDFEETVFRMNPEGIVNRDGFQGNLDRLFEFVGKGKADQRLFIYELRSKVAIAGRPVQMDPFSACRICGIA